MQQSRIFLGWRVVAGSGVGIAFGSVVFASGGFAQLAHAWGHDFGWDQSQLAKAATIYLILQMLTYPVFGGLLDRWGSRRVASASIVLFAAALIGLSRISGSLVQLYAAFAVIGLVSAGTNVVSYARALSLWFDRKRGLALGLAAGSQAVGGVLIPLLAAKIIASGGWSSAVLALAAFELLVCLPLVLLLVRDSPAAYGLLPDGAPAAVAGPDTPPIVYGPSRGEIIRSVAFWKLAVCFATMGLGAYALSINIGFILTQTAGLPIAEIAKIQATAGAAVLVGRIGFGYLLDRLHAPVVAIITLIVSATSIAIYAASPSPGIVLVGAVLMGCSIGGESDLMPYLASRYFGTRALSSVFGWFLAAFFVGAAIGPTAFASIATAQHSVVLPLNLLLALQLLPAALFLTLGRYPSATEWALARAPRAGSIAAPVVAR
jgi:MFS family permease